MEQVASALSLLFKDDITVIGFARIQRLGRSQNRDAGARQLRRFEIHKMEGQHYGKQNCT